MSLNIKITVHMSDFIPNAESRHYRGRNMSWHFTRKCLENKAAKLFIKRCICLNAKAKNALYVTLL